MNIFERIKDKNKLKKLFPVILLLLLITIVTGVTYAIYNASFTGNYNSITTGLVSMSFTESTNVITIDDALPISDVEGKTSDNYFDFSVTTNLSLGQNDPNTTLNYLIEIEPLIEVYENYSYNENATEEQINQCVTLLLNEAGVTEGDEDYEEAYTVYSKLCTGKPVEEFGGLTLQYFVDSANAGETDYLEIIYYLEPSGVITINNKWNFNQNATEEQINQCTVSLVKYVIEISEEDENYEETYNKYKPLCEGEEVDGLSAKTVIDSANSGDNDYLEILYILEPSGVVSKNHEWTVKKNPTESEVNKCISWWLEMGEITEEDEDYEEAYTVYSKLCSGKPVEEEDGLTLQMYVDLYFPQMGEQYLASFAQTGIIEYRKLENLDKGYLPLRDNQIKVYLEDLTNNRVLVDSKLVSNLNKHILYSVNHVHEYGTDGITTNYRLRAWIDYDTDASSWSEDNRYEYKFRVNINGDVKKESLVCYTTEQITDDDNNVIGVAITGYNEACGSNIEIPETYSYVPVVGYTLVENPTQEARYNCTATFIDYVGGVTSTSMQAYLLCSGKFSTINSEYSLETLFSDPEGALAYGTILKDTGMVKPLYGVKLVDYPTSDAIDSCTSAFLDYEGITEEDSGYKEEYSAFKTICSGGTYEGISLNMILSVSEYAAVFVPMLANTGILEFGQASTTETQTYPVLEIRDSAFESSNLTSVKIPSTVTTIGSKAFYDNNLTTISLSDNVTSIGDGAFTKNKLPESMAYIYARSDSDSDGVAEINNTKLVSYGGTLTDFNVPDTVTTIGSYAFDYSSFSDDKIIEAEIKRNCFTTSGSSITGYTCTDLHNVVIPEKISNYSIKTIGVDSFLLKNLSSLKLPSSITTINNEAFALNGLTNIVIPDSVKTIGDYAFVFDNLTNIVIPDSVISIGERAFGYNDLTSLSLGNKLTTIGESAFVLNKLTSVEIPNSVTTISSSAFSNNNLTNLTIPSSVTLIEEAAFSFNSNLISIVVDSNNSIYDSRDNSNAIIKTSTNELIVGCKNTTIPDGIKSIGNNAFSGMDVVEMPLPDSLMTIGNYAFNENNLTSITIPSSVTTIGYRAFQFNNLSNLTIPSNVTSIGDYAFQYNGLMSVTLPDNVTTIGEGAFYNNNLTSVDLPSKLIIINASVFSNNKLSNVSIPDNVTSIGGAAFYNNNLTSVDIPNTVTSIGNSAFDGNNLTSVTIPSSVTTIGNYAFSYNKLENVTMSNNVTTIGNGAFRNNNLTSIVLPSKITAINDYTFTSNKLTSVTIPSGVTSIGVDAFYNNKLTNVDIPNTVTSIGNRAFQTNSLTEVIIPSSVTTIGFNAFSNNKLTSVKIKGKSSSSEFTSYGTNIWGWASGYSDSNIEWNYTE